MMKFLNNFFNPQANTVDHVDPLFNQKRYDDYISARGGRRDDIQNLATEWGGYGDVSGTDFASDMSTARGFMDRSGRISGRFSSLSDEIRGLSDFSGFRKEASQARETYTGLRDELTDLQKSVGGVSQDPRISLEYQMASDAIDKDSDDSRKRLSRVLQERGIDPSSPAAISLMSNIERDRRVTKRQTRGQVIQNLKQKRMQERAERAGFIGARGDMTGRGLEATSLGANLTTQQIQGLVNSGQMTAQEANLLLQNAQQRTGLASLNAQREQFYKGGERDMALELLQSSEADVEKEWQNKIQDATLRAQINMHNSTAKQQAENQRTGNILSAVKIGAGVAMGNPASMASGAMDVANSQNQSPSGNDMLSQPLPQRRSHSIPFQLRQEQLHLNQYRPNYQKYLPPAYNPNQGMWPQSYRTTWDN